MLRAKKPISRVKYLCLQILAFFGVTALWIIMMALSAIVSSYGPTIGLPSSASQYFFISTTIACFALLPYLNYRITALRLPHLKYAPIHKKILMAIPFGRFPFFAEVQSDTPREKNENKL
jgi:hypothetical protein